MNCSAIQRSAWISGLLLLLASCSSEPAQDPHDFLLRSQSGPVSLNDFRGKVVLLFFGYTHCPDVCPATMNNIATALGRLEKKEADRVQTLFVTVDPERDNVARLKEYVAYFHPDILGLSGSIEQIKRAAGAYDVEFFRQGEDNAADYEIIHTSRLFLINTDGVLSDIMSHKTAPEENSSSQIK